VNSGFEDKTMRRPFASLVAAIAAAGLLAFPARADLGEIDRAFGEAGLVVSADSGVACGLCDFTARQVEATADGKILVGVSYATSWFHRWGYLGSGAAIARRNADGSVDASFGTDGVFTPPRPEGQYATLQKFVRLGDGRILAAGNTHGDPGDVPFQAGIYLVRASADGVTDSSFGVGGVVAPEGGNVSDLAVQADGRILLLLSDRLWRLLANGAPDTSFGTGGFVAISGAGIFVVAQPDGRILLLGGPTPSTGDPPLFVSRLLGDGSPDPSFATTSVSMLVTSAQLDPSGRLLLGGARFAQQGAALMRVLPDGGIDTGFGTAGVAANNVALGFGTVRLLPDGRILASGPVPRGFLLARFLPDGFGDGSLRGATYVTHEVHPYWLGSAFVIQPDGGALVAGSINYPRQVAFQAPTDSHLALTKVGGFTLDLFNDSTAFAAQQYRDFLSREGDAAGIAHWAGLIDEGTPRAAVVESFLTSPEFEAVVAPVTRLYMAYFDRLPDLAGLQFYIGYLRGTGTLQSISNVFAGSPEFSATYGYLTHEQFVRLVYQNVLGREPDAAGLEYWTTRLDQQMPRGEVMLAFSESPEYRAATASEVRVFMTYFGMLRRLPDAAGYDYWAGQAEAGASLQVLIDGFLASAEYHARFVP
jgi:uncharacterized delta-60 repeat protein